MRSTIKDVAEYANVSIATVSKHINGIKISLKNASRIEEGIKRLNYKVNQHARGLKTNRSNTVGIIVPTLENEFFMKVISHMESVLLASGYSPILCDCRWKDELQAKRVEQLLGREVDGIITMPISANGDYLKPALARRIPVVTIDRAIADITCDCVLIDNEDAVYNAVNLLMKNGHRRIGIVIGDEASYTSRERLKGYLKAYAEKGLQADMRMVKRGNYEIEKSFDAALELLGQKERPSALFATNYEMTLGTIMAANQAGLRIPEELSIIGFDNMHLAMITKPHLSIVTQPAKEIAGKAAELILKRMNGDFETYPEKVCLKTGFFQGGSVARMAELCS